VIIAISRRQKREKVMSRMSSNRIYQTLPLGSCSLKACFIAEGKADVFMRLGVTGEWDTGASQCIVSEAGGKILAADFEPLTYNRRNSLENPDFVVLGDQRVAWQDIVQY
jgi:3'(2'), 5'-bisphosphate nucleotidase